VPCHGDVLVKLLKEKQGGSSNGEKQGVKHKNKEQKVEDKEEPKNKKQKIVK